MSPTACMEWGRQETYQRAGLDDCLFVPWLHYLSLRGADPSGSPHRYHHHSRGDTAVNLRSDQSEIPLVGCVEVIYRTATVSRNVMTLRQVPRV